MSLCDRMISLFCWCYRLRSIFLLTSR